MSIDRKSFVTGLMMLMASALAPKGDGEQGEPVAYLYNGVRLPALPEWDKENYPYAVILATFRGYELFISPNQCFFAVDETHMGKSLSGAYGMSGGVLLVDYNDPTQGITGEWCRPLIYEAGTNLGSFRYCGRGFVWANHDFLCADGTVYLAGSKPVPVYE